MASSSSSSSSGPLISSSIDDDDDDESIPPMTRLPLPLPPPPPQPWRVPPPPPGKQPLPLPPPTDPLDNSLQERPIRIITDFFRSPKPGDPLTEEEKSYLKALKETQGFGMPGLSRAVRFLNIIMPCPVDANEETRLKFYNFCVKAIQHYNFSYGTCYSVLKVLKACKQLVAGYNYYITFQAKNDIPPLAEKTEKTFEAWVHEPLKGDVSVIFCRVQGDKSSSSIEMTWGC